MNTVQLIGRLTKDPETRYTQDNMAITGFTLAVDRMNKDKGADFIPVKVFGKQAENCERFLAKGKKVAAEGRIQTGSYENSEGKKVYTTDVIANRVEFLDSMEKSTGEKNATVPAGFEAIDDDDVPF